MTFKDYYSKDILKIKLVKNENYASYLFGINELKQEGLKIKAIVGDGKRLLVGGFGYIPIQTCHFHQVQILTRYITKKPKLQSRISIIANKK